MTFITKFNDHSKRNRKHIVMCVQHSTKTRKLKYCHGSTTMTKRTNLRSAMYVLLLFYELYFTVLRTLLYWGHLETFCKQYEQMVNGLRLNRACLHAGRLLHWDGSLTRHSKPASRSPRDTAGRISRGLASAGRRRPSSILGRFQDWPSGKRFGALNSVVSNVDAGHHQLRIDSHLGELLTMLYLGQT